VTAAALILSPPLPKGKAGAFDSVVQVQVQVPVQVPVQPLRLGLVGLQQVPVQLQPPMVLMSGPVPVRAVLTCQRPIDCCTVRIFQQKVMLEGAIARTPARLSLK
jgi:hypothetical protein